MQIREICVEDAAAFVELLVNLARESDYSILTDSEYQAGAAGQTQHIEQITQSPQQQIFLATDEYDGLSGFIALTQGSYSRNRHVCSLMIGVRLSQQGKGTGKALMAKALEWIAEREIVRTELTVAVENQAAINLYITHGFEKEGLKRQAYRVDGKPVDEWMMARITSP